MRTRTIRFEICLTPKESNVLNTLAKRSGLPRSTYIRHLINNVVPNDAPPPDYFAMTRELYKIGNNLNQIAQKAHILNVMDVQRYDEAVAALGKTVLAITEAVILPRKMEYGYDLYMGG